MKNILFISNLAKKSGIIPYISLSTEKCSKLLEDYIRLNSVHGNKIFFQVYKFKNMDFTFEGNFHINKLFSRKYGALIIEHSVILMLTDFLSTIRNCLDC